MEEGRQPSNTDLAAAASIAAGLVHATAAGTHEGDAVVVWLFVAMALAQCAVGVALLVRPRRALAGAAMAVNVVALSAWVGSRTTGLPWPDALGEPEAIGVQDGLAAALAVVPIVIGARIALGGVRKAAFGGAWLPALVAIPAVVAMAAPHTHTGASHDHGSAAAAHLHDEGADHDHGGASDGHDHETDTTEAAEHDDHHDHDASTTTEPAEGHGHDDASHDDAPHASDHPVAHEEHPPAAAGDSAAPHGHEHTAAPTTGTTHPPGHDDHGGTHGTVGGGSGSGSTGGGHSHGGGSGGGTTDPLASLRNDPRLAGADTSNATEAQLRAAIDLIDRTRAGASMKLTTTAAAEQAGYIWIGDGKKVGGFQHYVNHDLLRDGRTLDPDAVESLVFQNTGGAPKLVSAMYVLAPGQGMGDVPDVAGALTVWHLHQNLCWDDTGTKIVGHWVDGACRPAGTRRVTPPMLHVWKTNPPCGPFAGTEGHGSGSCGHRH